MKLPALDKQAHFLGGWATCLTFAVFWPSAVWMLLVGLLAAITTGYGKEQYDKRHPETHTYDMGDFYYTSAGGVVGFLIGVVAYLVGMYM